MTTGTRTPGRLSRLGGLGGLLAGNVGARVGALASLALATVLVARSGGPGADGAVLVGALTLLRVLPGVFGVISSGGLPGASPYFLSSPAYDPARVRATLGLLIPLAFAVTVTLWLTLTPLWYFAFFRHDLGLGLAAAAAIPAGTQLFVHFGKGLLQGGDDLRGANATLFLEEFVFLPIYATILLMDLGVAGILAGLVAADLVVAAGCAVRLARRGFFSGWGRPDRRLAWEMIRYGARNEIGWIFQLLNSRLDVLLIGSLGGTAALGYYAVAAKYGEVLRFAGQTGPYILYPTFAKEGAAAATHRATRLLAPALGGNVLAAIPLALLAGVLIPWIFGEGFGHAVLPALILIGGLLLEGVSGLIGSYLMGVGRPGLNSAVLGVSFVVVLVLQVSLIPPFGVVGAAVATAIGYVVTGLVLMGIFVRVRRTT